MKFYSGIVFILILLIMTMSAIIHENARYPKEIKSAYYVIFFYMALMIVLEWMGVSLNSAPSYTIPIHTVVKYCDYICTPMIGVLFLNTIIPKGKIKYLLAMKHIIAFNVVLETISIFTGIIFYVNSDNIYGHGPYYWVYMIIYTLCIVHVFYNLFNYSKKFKHQNRASLIMIIIIVFTGALFQELDSEIRTMSFAITLALTLAYIHRNEYFQLSLDDQLLLDVQTGVKSRYAYSVFVSSKKKKLEDNLVVYMLDINGLKRTNDILGHEVGDLLIEAASDCIKETFDGHGEAYRIGGDEFVVVMYEDNKKVVHELYEKFLQNVANFTSEALPSISISEGYALSKEHPGATIEELVSIADSNMYEQKRMHYASI